MNPIGIMQGRLAPAGTGRRVQSFPWSTWRDEFHLASRCGFDAIEWLFTAEDHPANPIWTEAGASLIRASVEETGVAVRSICAHHFLERPFFRGPARARAASLQVLDGLIDRAARLGALTIVVPVLEESEPQSADEVDCLVAMLRGPAERAQALGVRLAIEMDCPVQAWMQLLSELPSAVGVCYDTGNSAAAGHHASVDLPHLAPRLHAVHVKDRVLGGVSVSLGDGDADIDGACEALRTSGYDGLLVLETPPGSAPVASASAHLQFVRSCLERARA